jgi:putative two-component system response regulator
MSEAKPTILAIDDAEGVRRLLEVTLGKSQVVKTAPDAHSALAWAQLATPPDLVLLDTEPAGMSGYELAKALRAMPGFADVPVIFLAERRDPQGLVQGYSLGALDFLMKPLAAPVLMQRIRGHLEQLARERTAGLQGAELRIGRLVRAMQLHERSLGGNRAQRLAQYARALALAAGARAVAADLLAKAAPVHDVGKLAVQAELLHNERALAGAEREQFERHAAIGAEIIGEHDDALLKLARTLALTHHEYWDGSGYPGRLQGNQIPWAGRVMGIVDAFESTTAAQYGGSRMSTEGAVAEIAAGAGTQFDPALVEALRKAAAEFRKVHGAFPERAADAGDDLVIGAPSVRPAAARAEPPAAAAEDLVLGAPAHDPADDAGLTMMGPLRLGAGAASSDKLREAIQRAAAKAQAPPTVEEKPAAAPPAEKHDELKRAQETLAQAQKDRAAGEAALAQARSQARGELEALRARASELETERAGTQAALAQARAELDALNARINSRSETELQLQELRGELQIRANELEATRAALAEARAELDGARGQPVAEPAQPQAELQQAHAELQARMNELKAARAALSKAHAELEAARAQPLPEPAAPLEELVAAQTQLAQAHAELQQARAELERANAELAELRSKPVAAEDPQSQAEITELRGRINDLETARAAAAAALSQAHAERGQARAEIAALRAAAKQLEGQLAGIEGLRNRVNELESERAAVAGVLSEARAERERTRGELEGLRARVNDLQMESAAADVAHERRNAEETEAQARLAEIQAAIEDLQKRREDAEITVTALEAKVLEAQATLEAETERARIAVEQAPAVMAAPAEPAAAVAPPRPIATLLIVAFLFGALAMGVTYLLFHP